MPKICKYTIPQPAGWDGITKSPVSTVKVEMPIGARLLSVQVQDNQVRAWAVADPEAECIDRTFLVLATGDTVPDGELHHLATVQLNRCTLVLHVFEVDSPEAKDTW